MSNQSKMREPEDGNRFTLQDVTRSAVTNYSTCLPKLLGLYLYHRAVIAPFQHTQYGTPGDAIEGSRANPGSRSLSRLRVCGARAPMLHRCERGWQDTEHGRQIEKRNMQQGRADECGSRGHTRSSEWESRLQSRRRRERDDGVTRLFTGGC